MLSGVFADFLRRPRNGLEQRFIGLCARLEACGLLEIPDCTVRARAIETVDAAIIIAAASEFSLDVRNDLLGSAQRVGYEMLGRNRGRDCVDPRQGFDLRRLRGRLRSLLHFCRHP